MIFPAPNSPTIPQVFHKAPCSLTTPFTSQPHLLPPSALFAELQASLLPFLVSNISPPTPARSLPCLKALHLLLPHPGSHFLALFRVQFHVIYSGRPSLIPVPLHSLFRPDMKALSSRPILSLWRSLMSSCHCLQWRNVWTSYSGLWPSPCHPGLPLPPGSPPGTLPSACTQHPASCLHNRKLCLTPTCLSK